MKVLIITYYWVPAGGSGIQRWLKFVKYLRDFGIEPIIFTVKNPNYPIEDSTLKKDVPKDVEVIRNSIVEPNTILAKLGLKQTKNSAGFLNSKPSVLGKLARYIRANIFIPDARRFWISPSVKKIVKYIESNPVDAIITTGPPHSVHLIGLGVKDKLGLKWIADFRDPWTKIDYFHALPLTKNAIVKHRTYEKNVLEKADLTLVIGNHMKEDFLKYTEHIEVITNGYDIERDNAQEITLDKNFTITYIGLMNADRNPTVLWEVLSEICSENSDFAENLELKFIGNIAREVEESLANFSDVRVTKLGYLPHNKVQDYQCKSQVLLLTVNNVPNAKGIITGKIFEYLQAKRPILAIGPENGDLADILKETSSGVIVDFKNHNSLKKEIIKMYKKYKEDRLFVHSNNISQYHRRELTKKLSELLKSL